MGYQVGRVCYDDYSSAINVYASQIQPRIREDGTVIAPVYSNEHWTISELSFAPDFPKCDSSLPLKQGIMISAGLVSCLIVVFSVRAVKAALEAFSYD